jgi:hypothetical protein
VTGIVLVEEEEAPLKVGKSGDLGEFELLSGIFGGSVVVIVGE